MGMPTSALARCQRNKNANANPRAYATMPSPPQPDAPPAQKGDETMDWAGVAIIVTVQVAIFLYLLRRMDNLSDRISDLRTELLAAIAANGERIARLEGVIQGRRDAEEALAQTGDD